MYITSREGLLSDLTNVLTKYAFSKLKTLVVQQQVTADGNNGESLTTKVSKIEGREENLLIIFYRFAILLRVLAQAYPL